MKIVVAATDEQWDELTAGRSGTEWLRVDDPKDFTTTHEADIFLNVKDNSILPDF